MCPCMEGHLHACVYPQQTTSQLHQHLFLTRIPYFSKSSMSVAKARGIQPLRPLGGPSATSAMCHPRIKISTSSVDIGLARRNDRPAGMTDQQDQHVNVTEDVCRPSPRCAHLSPRVGARMMFEGRLSTPHALLAITCLSRRLAPLLHDTISGNWIAQPQAQC